MRNRNPKIVEVIDAERRGSFIFKCKKCGHCWLPQFKDNGRFYRGAWQCPRGCKLKEQINDTTEKRINVKT